jgi:hypothetical protein
MAMGMGVSNATLWEGVPTSDMIDTDTGIWFSMQSRVITTAVQI